MINFIDSFVQRIKGGHDSKKERCFIFGTGEAGQCAYRHIKSTSHVIGFIDNDVKKQGRTLYGKTIYSPERLKVRDYTRILIASMYYGEIMVQLVNSMKLPPEMINVSSWHHQDQPGFLKRFYPASLEYKTLISRNPNIRRACYAAECYENLPLRPDHIMYESYNGREFACNPYALFRYLLNHEDYQNMVHVVAVNDTAQKKLDPFRSHPRVRIVEVDSEAYIEYAQTCKYFINNVSFKPYIAKRKGQIFITTWHSTLLKKLGYDTGRIWETKNTAKALLMSDYFISPNEFTTRFLFKSQGVDRLFSGKVVETGYPRNDFLFNTDKQAIRERLNVPPSSKLLVYAPTWREEFAAKDTVAPTLRDVARMRARFPDSVTIVVKFHSMVYPHLSDEDMRQCVPGDMDTNELLAATDILITDYSGIMYDYMITGNPLVLYTPDLDEYAKMKKGFYLDINTIPAPVCRTIDELAVEINKINLSADHLQADAYRAFARGFIDKDDGNTCRRVADIVFKGVKNNRDIIDYQDGRVKRVNLLMCPGALPPNGVTTGFLALLGKIDYEKYNVTVLLPNDYAGRQYQRLIHPKATVVYNTIPFGYTLSEYKKKKKMAKKGLRHEKEAPVTAFQRNIRRLLPDLAFDVVIDYNGYSPDWAATLCFGVQAGKRVIYMHNSLYRDMIIKQPQLHAVFSLYKYFDRIMCVTADSLRENIEEAGAYIQKRFGYDISHMMDYTHNMIDPDNIVERARHKPVFKKGRTLLYRIENPINVNPDDLYTFTIPAPVDDHVNFITIGRLSPEKNHIRMLKAFRLLADKHANVRLYLVGQGVMKDELERAVQLYGLGQQVIFVNHISNPFPLLDMCDCFVLSSDIEGQAITILEALALGKWVISTDIPGPRSMLKDGQGILVPATSEALAKALISFVESSGRVKPKRFDPAQYVRDAIRMYEQKVFGVADVFAEQAP